jgi:nucleoside-diphosphate-sugar epimerase
MKNLSEIPIIAIVGANGFVGKHLVRALTARKDVLVRTLARSPLDEGGRHTNVTAIQGDLTKPETLKNFLVPGCIVVNLAYGFNMTSTENLQAAKNLAVICKDSRIKRLIHCSTASVFGCSQGDVANEQSLCSPRSEYGLTKLKIEEVLYEASKGNFELVNLRPTSVFGPGGKAMIKLISNLVQGNIILNYLRSCLFNTRKLNLVNVDTVTAAILFMAETEQKVDGETFIVSEDSESINNFHFVERYLLDRLVGRYYAIRPLSLPLSILSWMLRVLGRDGYNPRRVYDSSKILQIGFHPPMSLEHSLDKFVEWYKTQSAIEQREGM